MKTEFTLKSFSTDKLGPYSLILIKKIKKKLTVDSLTNFYKSNKKLKVLN